MFLSDRLVPEEIRYNSRAGQYTRSGRFVSPTEIDGLAISEGVALSRRLERITKELIDEKIDLPTWQRSMAETLKKSHIRMTILANGGRERTGLNAYGVAGRNLKEEYGYLNNFAQALAKGELSPQQAIARSKLYGQSTVQTYYEAFYFNKKREGFRFAWRTLDPLAEHCPDCPSLTTSGFVPIDQVTPKGDKCRCRGRCRCLIRYRR